MTHLLSSERFQPIKVIDIELSRPLKTFENLDDYIAFKAVVRLHGTPLGYIQLGVTNGCCPAEVISKAILDRYSWAIIRQLMINGLVTPLQQPGLHLSDLVKGEHPGYTGPFPLVTVAVCTRDRVEDLVICLDALCQLDYPALDILVVDNAPRNDATERLIHTRYPSVRYVCEPRPGLSWARNRAIIEARGEIIAYTDDDVVVDAGWVRALAQLFAENPGVMAITGLVVPYELETEPQILFEFQGGFGRGFERRWYRLDRQGNGQTVKPHGAGQFGTGANMAYRLSLFERIGRFNPALGAGTVTNGGEDLEMFFRLLQEGYTLVYEPRALVYHRHRRDYASLRQQLTNNGLGLSAYMVAGALAYPTERAAFIQLWLWWLRHWHVKRWLKSLIHPYRFPRDLILADFWGYFKGLGRYKKAERVAASIAQEFGPQEADLPPQPNLQVSESTLETPTPARLEGFVLR